MLDQIQLNEFLESQTGQRALQEHQQEQAAKRQDLAEQLAVLKSSRAAELAPLEEDAEGALVACEQARRDFEQAELRLRHADSKLNKVRSSYAARIRSLESQIIRTAPLEIDAFINEMREEVERMQNTGISVTVDGKQSNRVSFEARMVALRRTIDEAGKLRTIVIDDLSVRLNRMRDALPKLEQVSVSSDTMIG